jgi:septum formation protein
MASKQVFLASDSPRRKKLLASILGRNFKIINHLHDEDINVKAPVRHVKMNARGKALEGASRVRSGIVIGADTVVVCRGKILGKPGTKKKAAHMLSSISGRDVRVITGISIIDLDARRTMTSAVKTKLKIRKLSQDEIKWYVGTGEPLDKAGGFGIQGKGRFLVEKIKGDYSNVVGLPLKELSSLLKKIKVKVGPVPAETKW